MFEVYFWLTYLGAAFVICYILSYCWFRRRDLCPDNWGSLHTIITIVIAFCPILNLFVVPGLVRDFISFDPKTPEVRGER